MSKVNAREERRERETSAALDKESLQRSPKGLERTTRFDNYYRRGSMSQRMIKKDMGDASEDVKVTNELLKHFRGFCNLTLF